MYDRADIITVKFRDGLRLRAHDGKLVDDDAARDKTVEAAIAQLAALPITSWEPVHESAPEALDALRTRAQANTPRPLPDLNLQFFAHLAPGVLVENVLASVNTLAIVELAQPVPLPTRPPVPPALDVWQDELPAAPGGIGARTVWTWPGGTAAGVTIVDLEYSWNRAHIDLPIGIPAIGPLGPDPFLDNNHGTCVLGEMVSRNNGFGTIGGAYGASIAVASVMTTSNVYNVAGAISRTALAVHAGDVILLEQQFSGPMVNSTTPTTQVGLVPVEWYRPNYDAIVIAVAAGIVVVEAAGNGQQNLDAAVYATGNGGHFPFLPQNDSGAIIVGAGCPPRFASSTDRSRLWFSNYGAAVRLQAAGESVVTTGDGDFFASEGVNAWYTGNFGGTSSASPIVASACALLQGLAKSARGAPVPPAQLREALIATGSAQQSGAYLASQHIGPRPNVTSAALILLGNADCNTNSIPDALESLTITPVVASVAARQGATAVLSIADAGSGVEYQWRRAGVPLADGPTGNGSTYSGVATKTLQISAAFVADSGVFTCVARDACPLSGAANITLTVTRCDADFNQNFVLEVEDIFAYLNAWFAGDPRADWDSLNGLQVYDIFLFLNNWFAGCH
jgi:hypothetical protein